MSYLLDDFKNIRTFPASVRAYRDGVLLPEFSNGDIPISLSVGYGRLPHTDDGKLPLHVVHIGRLTGEHDWNMTDGFLTARIETCGETAINIKIDPMQSFDGLIFVKNTGKLHISIVGNNGTNTRIICQTKLFAAAQSENEMTGLANIPPDTKGAETDIGFAALCDPRVRLLKMSPGQRISSVPKSAEHSASIWRPAPPVIQYLETAGLDVAAATALLNAAFMEEV